MRLISLVLGGVLVSAGVSHGQPGAKAMTVFVTAAPLAEVQKVDKETETRLLAAIKDAETKRKDLENEPEGAARQEARCVAAGRAGRHVRRRGGGRAGPGRLRLPQGQAGGSRRLRGGHP